MAAVSFELNAEVRVPKTKGETRRLRLENKIPVVLYGAAKESIPLALKEKEVRKALENESFYTRIITLNVAGKTGEKAIVKAIHRHAYKPQILHMDFQRVSEHQKLHIRVPLHFVNEAISPGVKLHSGVVSHNLIDVEISCLPADIPAFIEVDLSKLELGESIHLSQLKLSAGAEIVLLLQGKEQHDLPVVTIQAPRAEVEETPVEAAVTTAEGATATTETPGTTTTATPAGKTGTAGTTGKGAPAAQTAKTTAK